MVVVGMFLGFWYLLLEVGTKIHPLYSLYDDAGQVYQSFLVLHVLLAVFPGGTLLITSALHRTQGHSFEFVPQANMVIFSY